MNRFSFAVLALGVASISLLAACSSSSGGSSGSSGSSGGCAAYTVPAGFVVMSPTVSFKTDVIPIISTSCAFSSCHGANTGGNQGVKLTSDPETSRTSIVNVKSTEDPTMNFVTPGDTLNSYLMHKIDGDNCTLNASCTGGTCQDTMPQGSDLLTVDQRDVFRRWILQGAADN